MPDEQRHVTVYYVAHPLGEVYHRSADCAYIRRARQGGRSIRAQVPDPGMRMPIRMHQGDPDGGFALKSCYRCGS